MTSTSMITPAPLFITIIRHPPLSTLFPYTTLFRSLVHFDDADGTEYRLHVRAELSSFTVYESTRNAEPNAVMQYIVEGDRKSTRLNSSHMSISYAVFCLKKKIIYIRLFYICSSNDIDFHDYPCSSFYYNHTTPSVIYSLSLHDALPISCSL